MKIKKQIYFDKIRRIFDPFYNSVISSKGDEHVFYVLCQRRPNHFERNLKDLSPNFFLLYLFNIFLHKITLKEMIMWSAFSLICLVYFFDQVFQYLYKMSTPHIVCVNCLEISGPSSPLGAEGNPPPPILASIETKPVPLND